MRPEQIISRIRKDLQMIDAVFERHQSEPLKDQVHADLQADLDAPCTPLGAIQINYPPSLEDIGLKLDMSLDERRAEIGYLKRVREPSAQEIRLKQMAQDLSCASSVQSWSWRIGEEARALKDWYPFFFTLTVDPLLYDPREVFEKPLIGKNGFRKWVEKIAKEAKKAGGLTKRQRALAPDREWFRYVAAVEHGKSGEHHHAHVIGFLREIPDFVKKDPNAGKRPDHRVVREQSWFDQFWIHSSYGQSNAKYLRFRGDVWGRMGHYTPIEKGQPLKLAGPERVGMYLAKYMHKEKKQWTHRIKATHSIGLDRIKKLISEMAYEHLKGIIQWPRTYSDHFRQQTMTSVPASILKTISRKCVSLMELTFKTPTELLSPHKSIWSNMLLSVESGAEPWKMTSEQCWEWLTELRPLVSLATEGCYDAQRWDALKVVREHFPPIPEDDDTKTIGAMKLCTPLS